MHPLLDQLKDHADLIITAMTLATMLVPQWRRAVGRAIRTGCAKVSRWRHAGLYETQERILMLIEEGVPKWDRGCELAEKAHVEILDLKRIVTNGLSHSVAKLLARDRADFEAKPVPSFVCDETGANYLVSEGYANLIGMDRASLKGHGWENVITGPLKAEYLSTFLRAADNKQDFVGVVDFQHPLTGEHRGRWRVHAPCESVNEALIFTGTFTNAEDETAIRISEEHGWLIGSGDRLSLMSSQAPD